MRTILLLLALSLSVTACDQSCAEDTAGCG